MEALLVIGFVFCIIVIMCAVIVYKKAMQEDEDGE